MLGEDVCRRRAPKIFALSFVLVYVYISLICTKKELRSIATAPRESDADVSGTFTSDATFGTGGTPDPSPAVPDARQSNVTASPTEVGTVALENVTDDLGAVWGHGASPACRPFFPPDAKIERIYFAHVRKAGGTTLRKYFQRVAENYDLTFDVAEGKRVEAPGTASVGTFYVTVLRDPIERAVSHWKYSFRWDCKDLTNRVYERNSYRNLPEGKTFEQFFRTAEYIHREYCRRETGRKNKLWICAVGCYARWFGGVCPADVGGGEKRAARTLAQYNLIVLTESLRDPVYVQKLEEMFGVPGLKHKDAYCSQPSKRANRRYPPPQMSNETRQLITEANARDIALYDKVRDCPTGFHFPMFHPKYFCRSSKGCAKQTKII